MTEMTEGSEAMSIEFWWKIAMNQESYSYLREEKEKDIIKYEKFQKDISTKYILWKKTMSLWNPKRNDINELTERESQTYMITMG